MCENMVSINVVTQEGNGEVTVNVHHYHHFPDQSQSKVKASKATAKSAPSEVSSASVLPNGATVRFLASASALNKEGSAGSYLGVDESGVVVADLPRDSPRTLFQVVLKNGHTHLRSVGGKCLRVTAKTEVDALGGTGNWARFAVEPMAGSSIALKSAAPQHAAKMNSNGSEGLYVGVKNGKVVGDSGPFLFTYEIVEDAPAAMTKEERQAARQKERQERQAARLEMTKEERQAAKAARQAVKKQDQLKKQELMSGWTEVKASNPKAKAKGKAKTMPAEAVPAPVIAKKAEKKVDKNAFPTGSILLAPMNFLEVPNRKKTIGWHLGISPQGFLVPDASSGNWGTLTAIAVGDNIVLEASHTPAYHLAVDKNRLLTHRGGKCKFAQWVCERHGQFFSLRCVAHEEPAYLAVSSSGVLYTAQAPSKDTRFKVSSPVTTA